MRFLPVCLSLCLTVLSPCAANASRSELEDFIGAHDSHWDELKCDWDEDTPGRPSKWRGANKEGYYSGALMGNGLLGANMYKLRDSVYRINFSRSDVTEQRPWFDLLRQARLPIGYFTLSTRGKICAESMDLSLYNAETSGRFVTDKGDIRFLSYVHSVQDVFVFETQATGGEKDFVWDFVPFKAISPRSYDKNPIDPQYINHEGKSNPDPYREEHCGEHYLIQPLARDTTFTGIAKVYVVGWKELRRGSTRRILATIAFEDTKERAVESAHRTLASAMAVGRGNLRDSHRSWWHGFYGSAAFLSFPDPEVERFYWMQYYKFASTARPGKPVVDLMGVWPTFDTPWPAIWVNLNLQLTYSWQTKANLGYLAQPLWDALFDNRANLTRNVTDIPGQEGWTDSACLPRASSYDFLSPLKPSLANVNAYEVGNLAWTLFYWYRQCLAYGDLDAMRNRLFPLLKSATNIFFHIRTVNPDGTYSLPPTASPEYGEGKFCVGPDSNYDLANLRQALLALIDIDTRCAIGDPDRGRWEDFLDKMPPFQYDPKTGFKVSRDYEFLETSHRHYSHLFMVYPYHMLDWNDPEERKRAEFSIERWHGNTGYSHTGKAAMLCSEGRGDEAFAEIEDFIKDWVKPNTLYAESGPVIETPFACVSSLHEMYLQDWGDRLRVFYGCPSRWQDTSFRNMRADGAFLVSAERKGGKTVSIELLSECGNPCRIQCDMAHPMLTDGSGRDVAFEISQNVIIFNTVPGGQYIIRNNDR